MEYYTYNMNKTQKEIEKFLSGEHHCCFCKKFADGLASELNTGYPNAARYISEYTGWICPTIDTFLYGGSFYHDSSVDNT